MKNVKVNSKQKRHNAAVKAHLTRKVNALLDQYNVATSAGVKAGLRRKMNVLIAKRNSI